MGERSEGEEESSRLSVVIMSVQVPHPRRLLIYMGAPETVCTRLSASITRVIVRLSVPLGSL